MSLVSYQFIFLVACHFTLVESEKAVKYEVRPPTIDKREKQLETETKMAECPDDPDKRREDVPKPVAECPD